MSYLYTLPSCLSWQHYIKLKEEEKNRKLNDLLDALDFNQVVIFVKSVSRAAELDRLLIECNFPSICIHSGMSQEERFVLWDVSRCWESFSFMFCNSIGQFFFAAYFFQTFLGILCGCHRNVLTQICSSIMVPKGGVEFTSCLSIFRARWLYIFKNAYFVWAFWMQEIYSMRLWHYWGMIAFNVVVH